MSFTVEHAAFLKKHQERLVVGHHKFSQISRKRLEELVFVVSSLVRESAQYFYKATGKSVPRVCVSHDIWESTNGHWLGVTLFFIDVNSWEVLSFPIGFRRSKGKKASDISDQVYEIIRRYVLFFCYVFPFFQRIPTNMFLVTMFTSTIYIEQLVTTRHRQFPLVECCLRIGQRHLKRFFA
jgi:hypothetical protein